MANTQALTREKTNSSTNLILAIVGSFLFLIVFGIHALTHFVGQTVVSGEVFKVDLVHAAKIDGKTLRVVDISNSHCPEDVVCIWEGELEVLVLYGYRFYVFSDKTHPEVQITPDYKLQLVGSPVNPIDSARFVLKNVEE